MTDKVPAPTPTHWMTPGRDALCEWMKQPNRSQRKLARVLNVAQQSISFWMRGVNRPDYANMLSIEMVCGIQPIDWLTADERQKVAKMREGAFEARLSFLASAGDQSAEEAE